MKQLSPLQQAVLAVVAQYPGHFTRSGLAKMLVGAKSWQDKSFPEYGRFADQTRKKVTTDIDILVQQGFLTVDSHELLIPNERAPRRFA